LGFWTPSSWPVGENAVVERLGMQNDAFVPGLHSQWVRAPAGAAAASAAAAVITTSATARARIGGHFTIFSHTWCKNRRISARRRDAG
jgi:hypothetical protein